MKRNLYLDSEQLEDGINWNPSSQFEEEEPCLILESVAAEAREAEGKRPSHKNKYINKITLIKPEETANTKKKSQAHSESNLHPDDLKKIKNREAAKESRERKKLYINLIEEQARQLEREIEETNRQIEGCKFEIQKTAFQSNQSIGTFDSKMAHVIAKVDRLLAAEEGDDKDNEINLAIDSLLYRFGAAGKERKAQINESYRQIRNLAFSPVQRYILWSSKRGAHLFAPSHQGQQREHGEQPEQQEQKEQKEQRVQKEQKEQREEGEFEPWFQDMREILGGRIEGCAQSLRDKAGLLPEHEEEATRSIEKLNLAKERIEKFSSVVDNILLEIRDIFTPIQCIKLFFFIEKNKYRQEMRFIETQEPLEREFARPPTKRHKLDH